MNTKIPFESFYLSVRQLARFPVCSPIGSVRDLKDMVSTSRNW